MKANELRLGNWVLHITEPYQIRPYDFSEVNKDGDAYWTIEPIPLTEEWLVKFGFEKKTETSWKGNGYDFQPETSKTIQQDYYLDGFIFRFETWSYRKTEQDEWINELSTCIGMNDGWYKKVSCDKSPWYEIKYVHQLQNLYFALIGNELTIKE